LCVIAIGIYQRNFRGIFGECGRKPWNKSLRVKLDSFSIGLKKICPKIRNHNIINHLYVILGVFERIVDYLYQEEIIIGDSWRALPVTHSG